MLAHVAVSKYCGHIPLNRQSGMFARQGLELAPSTLGGWMASAARLGESLVEVMIERVLTSAVIRTDDTPVPVLDKNLDSTRQGRLWICRGDDMNPYTVYDYTPSRARDGPAEFLGSFEGYLHYAESAIMLS
jgi:transposase